MPRMSAAKRIELGKIMVERWQAKNCADDRSVRFVEDMLTRLERGRALTKRQREWYDSAVISDPPEPKNVLLVEQLLRDADTPGMEKVSNTLRDFARKVARGWSLSEKQDKFMKKLMAKAADIRQNGIWQPTPEQKAQIEIGVNFCRRYTSYYLGGQPGKARALQECKSWLNGDIEYLEEWSAQKMMNVCKGDRKLIADAYDRWPVGTLVVTKRRGETHGHHSSAPAIPKGSPGLIIGSPFVDDRGKPAIEVLIDGNPEILPLDNVSKRNPK